MALHDEILKEIMAGRVPVRFRTRDLKGQPAGAPHRYIVGAREYSENAINTIPRNHSVRADGSSRGDYSYCRKLDDAHPWTLREVEAVLFMEGY